MKAYVNKWYERGYRIGPQNIGGSKEIEIDNTDYMNLLADQALADSLQKDLARLFKGE